VVVLPPAAKSESRSNIETSLANTLDHVNDQLESHEKLERIVIASDEWTIENDLLTPTLKIKRSLLEEKYQQLISKRGDHRIQWELRIPR
jgi:long-subunit acyl-CoA synthetase (AMP-forming)